MPRQLPFVIAPQRVSEIVEIGTPDSGVLKFLKLGTVRVAEEAEMSDDLFRQTELALKVNRLLTKLMKETGKTREEIAEFLNDTTADPELSVRYEQEIAGVMDLSTGLNTQYSQVTCMLRHRVFRPELLEGNPTPEDLNQHCGIPEWTREDTLALNKNLFNAILQFATSEINGEPSKKKTSAKKPANSKP